MSRRTISPNGKFVRVWDLLSMLALIFTAFFTPFEIGFFDGAISPFAVGPINFAINRMIDSIFMLDILFTFFMPYKASQVRFHDRNPPPGLCRVSSAVSSSLPSPPLSSPIHRSQKLGGIVVYDATRIAKHYLTGWFVFDLLTSVPFDLIVGLSVGWEDDSSTQLIQILRAFRMVKLLRIVRAQRIIRRCEQPHPRMALSAGSLSEDISLGLSISEHSLGSTVTIVTTTLPCPAHTRPTAPSYSHTSHARTLSPPHRRARPHRCLLCDGQPDQIHNAHVHAGSLAGLSLGLHWHQHGW